MENSSDGHKSIIYQLCIFEFVYINQSNFILILISERILGSLKDSHNGYWRWWNFKTGQYNEQSSGIHYFTPMVSYKNINIDSFM